MELLTIDNIREVRQISASFDIEEFSGYLNEVSRNYLRQILGIETYEAFIADLTNGLTNPIYQDLYNGKTYEKNTIKYPMDGLKLMCIYFWLYLYANEGDSQLTNIGVRSFDADHSEQPTDIKTKNVGTQYQKNAIEIRNQVVDFLQQNTDIYTTYKANLPTQTNENKGEQPIYTTIGKNYSPDDSQFYLKGR